MNFSIHSENKGMTAAVTKISENNGVAFYRFTADFDTPQIPSEVTVSFAMPAIDTYLTWNPYNMFDRSLAVSWSKSAISSHVALNMPLQTLIAPNGKNKITLALSDAKTTIQICSGICKENATILWDIKFFTVMVSPMKHYSSIIRIDTRDIDFSESVRDTTIWWETECGYMPAYIPEHATLPMNSLWYSYHQNLDVEDILRECALSKKLGMDTVIIDDGWQTDDTNQGFKFCGDWQVCPSKIPDMKDFVRRIHDTGMKVILWYAVPFIGTGTKAYARFQDMLLDETGDGETYFSLDPRYKICRDYLIETYTNAISEWNIDGFKFDFISTFCLRGKSLEYDGRRDIHALEDAVECLLADISNRIKSINPEVLIEFCQSYSSPTMKKYGTMFRVADCPNDALYNRVTSIDLRLSAGSSAVHSDMLMWHPKDSVESAALQFIAALYCVPQVSVKIATLPESHKKMLAFYLSFWRANRDILLNGKLRVFHPEAMYSKISAEKEGTAIITSYVPLIQDLAGLQKATLINASWETSILLKNAKGKSFTILDCTGEVCSSGTVACDLFEIHVPLSGMAIVQ